MISFIFISFLAVVFFSFAMMIHGADGSIVGDCPFSALDGVSLCPRDTLSLVEHYVSVYYALLNIPLHSDIALLFLSLLFVAYATLIVFIYSQVFLSSFVHWQLRDILYCISSFSKKITRWLSLLQHSPSVT
ncbi:MAG: hypothetical protein AAB611_01680 [Patescibacteria group bacterium]